MRMDVISVNEENDSVIVELDVDEAGKQFLIERGFNAVLENVLNELEADLDTRIYGGDNVNRPSHYVQGKVECIDGIESAIAGLTGMEAMCIGNAIKYLWRTGLKNTDGPRTVNKEDINKAIWYLKKVL